MRVVTNQEMRDLDQRAIDTVGIPSMVLMENAGLKAAKIIHNRCLEGQHKGELLIFVGKGKNGGDGLVVARHLLAWGHKVRIFLLHPFEEYQAESKLQLNILLQTKAKVSFVESKAILDAYFQSAVAPFFIVDALLGTGITRPVEGLYYDVIEAINQYGDEIIALDIPSGISGNSGQVLGTSVLATQTISFGYPKLGHFFIPGAARRGKLFNVDLSFPLSWQKEGDKVLLEPSYAASLLKARDKFGHKNSFGHCLLIGGSPGRIGAIVMASQSCLKMGTGLVTVASWEDSYPSLEIKLSSEVMNFKIQRHDGAFIMPPEGLSYFSSIVVGPGLGLRSEADSLMELLLKTYRGSLVIDADGLNLVAANPKLLELLCARQEPTVLTPHPGEMSRLLKWSKDKVLESPIDAVRKAVEVTHSVVLLKGPTTLIHSIEDTTWLSHYPNDGMATAGSGDVLAGMIGGLLGQRIDVLNAALLGVHVHSLAGRFAADQAGHRAMTASDLINHIQSAFQELRRYQHPQQADVYLPFHS